ncbi:DUF3597 family protein [bacterium]|nr:DUF3597 family protein [bacterium]
MKIFGDMWNSIFKKGGKGAAPPVKAPPVRSWPPKDAPASPTGKAAPAKPSTGAPPWADTSSGAGAKQGEAAHTKGPYAAPASPAAAVVIDVEEVLEKLAAEDGRKLNWRTSIVDLMKLLDVDSSLPARKELADELGYTGSKVKSAEMNIWLHKQVMRMLAENGGKVPPELLD